MKKLALTLFVNGVHEDSIKPSFWWRAFPIFDFKPF